jgi:hypothetical protein
VTAASALGSYLRHGSSLVTDEPYARLLTVDSIVTDGRMLVARLQTRTAGAFDALVDEGDFPLFWSR